MEDLVWSMDAGEGFGGGNVVCALVDVGRIVGEVCVCESGRRRREM